MREQFPKILLQDFEAVCKHRVHNRRQMERKREGKVVPRNNTRERPRSNETSPREDKAARQDNDRTTGEQESDSERDEHGCNHHTTNESSL